MMVSPSGIFDVTSIADGYANTTVEDVAVPGGDVTWVNFAAIRAYTVTPSAGSNGGISPAVPQTVSHGQTRSFTVTPDTGYHIASVTGCGGTLSGNTYTTGTITADCTVSAAFAIDIHPLTVAKSGTGSGTVASSPAGISCGTTCSGTYNAGTTITLTSTPDSGSIFASWSGDADCTDGIVTMNSIKACTAIFNLSPSSPIVPTLWGDLDSSNRVDGFDLGRLGLAFGSRPGDPNWDPDADLNGDGIVDGADLAILVENFGKTK